MKLQTRLILPSVIFLIILIGLGATKIYQTRTLSEQNEKIEMRIAQLSSSSNVIIEKADEHFNEAILLLTELETDIFRGNLVKEKEKLLQVELNILSYFDNFANYLDTLPAPLDTFSQSPEIHSLRGVFRDYFSIVTQSINIMREDEDAADILLMQASLKSIETHKRLRDIIMLTHGKLRALSALEQQHEIQLFSLLWWSAFGLAFIFTVFFGFISTTASHKLQVVLDRFTNLFPDADLDPNIRTTNEGIKKLEWLAGQLADTQNELSKSQIKMNQIISESSTAIYVHRHMKPLFANRALVELCGFEAEDDLLALESTEYILAPHDRKRVIDIHEDRLRGKETPNIYELELLRTDGEPRWVLNKSFVIDWDGEAAICTTLIDITKRKQAEQRLLDSEDRFQELLELTPDPIFIHTLEGKIVDVNAAACDSLNYERDELLKIDVKDFSTNDEIRAAQFFWNEGKEPKLIKSVQTHHRRKDGSSYPVEVNITSGFLDGQRVILAMAHDMSQTMAHIEELDALRLKAEDASKAKSEFLSMMSHELRTPLNAIIGYSDLYLQTSAKKGEPAKEEKWISEIKGSGHQLLEIIDKVLDLITIDKEIENNTDASSDIITQLDTCLVSYEKLAHQNNISLVFDQQDHAPFFINASEKSLHMVIENLISNAIKFNEPNGFVFITLQDKADNILELSVRNSGNSIDTNDHANAFQPFNRLGQENGPIPGNGIGLTLVQKITDNIGAEIKISTPEDGGCCFTVLFKKASVT